MPKYIKSEHQLNDIEKDRDKYIGGSLICHTYYVKGLNMVKQH